MIVKRLLMLALLGATFATQAYELASHAVVTQAAFSRSILQTGTILQDLGIDSNNTNPFGDSYFDVFGNQVVQRDLNANKVKV